MPGTPLTWARALRKYGTISLREALKPGIRVASKGFVVDQTFFNSVEAIKSYFDDIPSTAAIYLDADGSSKDVGTTLRNPDLAKTYRLLGREGVRNGFYAGPLAAATAQAAANPPTASTADHTWRKGLMTTDDLKRYSAPERAPIKTQYRGLTVYGMGPPSSRRHDRRRGAEHPRRLHARRRDADADPAPLPRGVALHLRRPQRLPRRPGVLRRAGRRADVDLVRRRAARADRRHGRQEPRRRRRSLRQPGRPPRRPPTAATISHPRQSTTHLTTADSKGNVVSYTFTIESTGGNGVVVPGYGFLLNNELTDFNYDSKTPPEPVEGSKRPRSSMSPTIIDRDGKPYLAIGSPGGSTIIGTVLQTIVNRIDLREPLPNAIALPRAVERNTASAQAEQAFIDSQEGRDLVGIYGHTKFTPPPAPGEIGAATGIEIRGKRFVAAAEPQRRGQGAAGVVEPK